MKAPHNCDWTVTIHVTTNKYLEWTPLLLNRGYGAVKKTFKLNRFLAKVWASRREMYITAIFTHVVLELCKSKNLRYWFKATLTLSGVRGAGRGRRAAPRLENSGQTLFSGQAQAAQKFWKIKNISIQWKFSGQILFFRASPGCSKFWMIKNIYSVQWIQGTLCFSGQAQVAQKSWKIKNISTQWKVSGQLWFSGQESCSKIWIIKNQWWAVRGGKEGSSSPTIIMKCAKRIRDPK